MTTLFAWTPPPFIPSDAWSAFVAMRCRGGRKKDWTELARDRAVKKLAAMRERGVDLAEVLLTCAEFGWVGVEWGEAHILKQAREVVLHSRRDLAASSANEPRPPTSKSGVALHTLQRMKR